MHSSLLSSPGYPASTRSITFSSFYLSELEIGIVFLGELTFLNKRGCHLEKKLTMDEQNGSLREIKQ